MDGNQSTGNDLMCWIFFDNFDNSIHNSFSSFFFPSVLSQFLGFHFHFPILEDNSHLFDGFFSFSVSILGFPLSQFGYAKFNAPFFARWLGRSSIVLGECLLKHKNLAVCISWWKSSLILVIASWKLKTWSCKEIGKVHLTISFNIIYSIFICQSIFAKKTWFTAAEEMINEQALRLRQSGNPVSDSDQESIPGMELGAEKF